MAFDKRQTNIAKGIAILMLLFRHLFLVENQQIATIFTVRGIPIERYINDLSMGCVAIFLFLSGYGLHCSFKSYTSGIKHQSENARSKNFKFVKKHLVKLCFPYYVIFLLTFVLDSLFKENVFAATYGNNIVYFIIDFLGLADILKTPTISGTFWFMSLIIFLYCVFILLEKINNYSSELLFLITLLFAIMPVSLYFEDIFNWCLPFCLGMIFAKYDFFNLLFNRIITKLKIILVLSLFFITVVVLRFFYLKNDTSLDAFLALSIIMISFMIVSKIPILNLILHELGKLSLIMFLLHPLIYSLFLQVWNYKISLITYLILIILTYVCSKILQYLFDITGYNRLILKLS